MKYGVQVMPSFPGTSGGHQTISGPDNWVIFNNGSQPGRGRGEVPALADRATPQVKYFSLAHGDLPTRQVGGGLGRLPDQQMDQALPGVSTFVANLANVKQARPQIPTYPKISTSPRPA